MAGFPLDQDRVRQLDNAVSTPIGDLEKIDARFSDPLTKLSTVSELRRFLESEIGVENPVDLAGALIFLHGIHSRNNISIQQAIASIEESLEDWELPESFMPSWRESLPLVTRIADSAIIKHIYKRNDLYYRHKLHLHDMKIITELRPVLDGPRNEISEFILMNRIHLVYSNPSETETYLEIPVGIDELERLKVEIDVALSKANVIQGELSKPKAHQTTFYSKRQKT